MSRWRTVLAGMVIVGAVGCSNPVAPLPNAEYELSGINGLLLPAVVGANAFERFAVVTEYLVISDGTYQRTIETEVTDQAGQVRTEVTTMGGVVTGWDEDVDIEADCPPGSLTLCALPFRVRLIEGGAEAVWDARPDHRLIYRAVHG